MPKSDKAAADEVQMDRRTSSRRATESAEIDSENSEEDAAPEFKAPRRRKQRRRQIDPTTCERDYNNEEILFMQALDEYKRSSGRMFPTCSEILEVVRGLGYVKLSEEDAQLLASLDETADDAFADAEVLDGEQEEFESADEDEATLV